MVYPPPSAHAHFKRSQLEATSKYEQVDIYTLDAIEMMHLWIAVKKSEGLSKDQAIKKLNELTGLSIIKEVLEFAKNYASAINSGMVLTVLAKDLSRSGNLFTHYYVTRKNGKKYIIFKGNQKLRKIIKGTRYLTTNTQMMKFGIGGNAIRSAAKSGFLVSVVFSLSLNSIRWLFEEEFRWPHWVSHLSADVLKITVASIAGYLAAAGAAAGAALFMTSVPVILPITVGLFIALVVGEVVSIVDRDVQLAKKVMEAIEVYEKKVNELNQTLLDGLYYTIDETKKYAVHQVENAFP